MQAVQLTQAPCRFLFTILKYAHVPRNDPAAPLNKCRIS
jgi:hypothetical protein